VRVIVREDTVFTYKDLKAQYYPIGGTGIAHDLGNACGFDTDEKWIEIVPLMPGNRAMTATVGGKGGIVRVKLYIDYDIVNKNTGEILHSVRQ
jgi:hypothetical protein